MGMIALIILVAVPASVSAADPVQVNAKILENSSFFNFSVNNIHEGAEWSLDVGTNSWDVAGLEIDVPIGIDWQISVYASETEEGSAKLYNSTLGDERYLDNSLFWSIGSTPLEFLSGDVPIYSDNTTFIDTFWLSQEVTDADYADSYGDGRTPRTYQNTLTFTATFFG